MGPFGALMLHSKRAPMPRRAAASRGLSSRRSGACGWAGRSDSRGGGGAGSTRTRISSRGREARRVATPSSTARTNSIRDSARQSAAADSRGVGFIPESCTQAVSPRASVQRKNPMWYCVSSVGIFGRFGRRGTPRVVSPTAGSLRGRPCWRQSRPAEQVSSGAIGERGPRRRPTRRGTRAVDRRLQTGRPLATSDSSAEGS